MPGRAVEAIEVRRSTGRAKPARMGSMRGLLAAARMAGQLHVERPYFFASRIADDAATITSLALAIAAGRAPPPALARIQALVGPYGARATVARRRVRLRFCGGHLDLRNGPYFVIL